MGAGEALVREDLVLREGFASERHLHRLHNWDIGVAAGTMSLRPAGQHLPITFLVAPRRGRPAFGVGMTVSPCRVDGLGG
ncbi:hypothetical protein, partial [Streptomyces sp. NPDC047868]